MKTTLDLPDDLMREVKIRAAREDRRLKDLLAQLIRSGLSLPPATGRKDGKRKPAFPVIRCPDDAPIIRMSGEEVLAQIKNFEAQAP